MPSDKLWSTEDMLDEYGCGEQTEMEYAVRDVLTDLRNLCDVHGLNFGDIDRRAYQEYMEEK